MEIQINLDDMLIGDMEVLESPDSSKEMLDLLDRLTPGVDIRNLNIRIYTQILDAVRTALREMRNNPNSDEP